MNSDPSSPRRLYMDNAATSFPKPKAVLAAMMRYATELGASAGRGGYQEAIEAAGIISKCRRRLQKLFAGEATEHFVFTLNCTDALNLAIHGLIDRTDHAHAICTHIDHNSILRPLNSLVQAGCLEQTRVPVDPVTGLADPNEIRRAIRPQTKLIAITHASNVTGSVQPIREIGRIAREHGIPFIVDAAQSAGHVPIHVVDDGIDLLAAPGHKGLLGPLGTGFLYIRPGLEKSLRSVRQGGTGSISEQDSQPDFLPDKYESGSHNMMGIVGLNAALQWLGERGIDSVVEHQQALIGTMIEGISDIEGLKYFGPRGAEHRVGVFSMQLDGFAPAELAAVLESHFGILTRAGIHCAPLAHAAIGTTQSGGATRLSFGPFLSTQDVRYACDALAEIAQSRLPMGK
jgi:cysteine desulfurase/selenocysteine lyase